MIRSRAIEHHDGFQLRSVSLDQFAHAAEIPLPLFSHISCEQNRAHGFHVGRIHRPRDGHKSRNACAVIGNAGCSHAVTVAMDFYICARGKNSIDVRRK